MTWYEFLTALPAGAGTGLIVSLGLKGLHKLSDLLRRGETVTEEVLLEELQGCNAEALDWIRATWGRVERTQANTTEILDRLESLTNSVRKLDQTAQSDPQTDRDAVLFLGNRLQEVLDAVQAADERQAEQLQDIRSGLQLVLPANFTVVRDLDQPDAAHRLMRALDLHPEDVYLDRLVERPQVLNQAPTQDNVLVTGIPGAGKTTLIHQILVRETPEAVVIAGEGFGRYQDDMRRIIVEDLPRRFTLVYDNIQKNPKPFHDAVTRLQVNFPDRMRVLCACRSADLPNVEHPQVIGDFRNALRIGHEAVVPELSTDEAEQVVALCEAS